MVPKPFIYISVILGVLLLIPPALIAWARATTSEKPRIHFVQDMDNQHKLQAQQRSELFFDGRTMRPPVAGAVGRDQLGEDAHYEQGLVGDGWATDFPAAVTVDMSLLERGQERFEIYCSICHGKSGYGDGMIHERAMRLMLTPSLSKGTTWVAPKSIHEEAIREQPVGQLFNTVTNGVRNMSGYGAQISTADRWAIVAYVKALQRSQHAEPGDVPDARSLPRTDITLPSLEEDS
ncbi:MAG: c-type cytochrome [Planctomycetota bacterium]|jgi:mono/diheme cytochrome c family protein